MVTDASTADAYWSALHCVRYSIGCPSSAVVSWSEWGQWGECSAGCGQRIRIRKRQCSVAPKAIARSGVRVSLPSVPCLGRPPQQIEWCPARECESGRL